MSGNTDSPSSFAASGADDPPYRLLLEGADFADREDFEAVWMPERHFHEFGGQFPNPGHYCCIHVFYAPDAGRWWRTRWSADLWQE